ncbi:MAG TPA: SLC13 family permease [Acidimicrobiales bacterium]|nr:SLC13 family permease [Acidimicrobiales bacterium]
MHDTSDIGVAAPRNLLGPLAAPWGLAALGAAGALAAAVASPADARAAAAQDWPAFALVSGLLLIGLVAQEDRLFEASGHLLARFAPNGWALYAGSALLVVVVTTLLNLDTSVTFLTPVLVYAARRRGESEVPLLVACLLLSNAGSLLLPGSNLTNAIVLGHLHLSGRSYFAHMAPAGLAAAAVTALVIAAAHRQSLRTTVAVAGDNAVPVVGVGLLAVAAVTVLVVVLKSPALPVLAVGLVAVALRARRGTPSPQAAAAVLGLPVLVGLFGLAVALGALGRSWSGPATLLSHLDGWGTAAVAALVSVAVNNLPAASLLAARPPPHPYPLLVGLNVSPNLFVTGSLAWVLWLRAARATGAQPDIRRAVLLGLVSVPLAIAAALLVLGAEGLH